MLFIKICNIGLMKNGLGRSPLFRLRVRSPSLLIASKIASLFACKLGCLHICLRLRLPKFCLQVGRFHSCLRERLPPLLLASKITSTFACKSGCLNFCLRLKLPLLLLACKVASNFVRSKVLSTIV